MSQTNIEVTPAADPTDDLTRDDDDKTAVDEVEEKPQDGEPTKEDPNLDSEQVDYKEKFSDSAKEAIRLSKENDSLTSKATLQDKMIEVAKDQEQIHEVAKHNPEIAAH